MLFKPLVGDVHGMQNKGFLGQQHAKTATSLRREGFGMATGRQEEVFVR